MKVCVVVIVGMIVCIVYVGVVCCWFIGCMVVWLCLGEVVYVVGVCGFVDFLVFWGRCVLFVWFVGVGFGDWYVVVVWFCDVVFVGG